MSRIILIQDDDYERQYLESKNYLNSKFHDHPTRLKNIPTSDLDRLGQSAYNNIYSKNTPPSGNHRNTPLGKLVI
jgi:hypothetical protein